MFVYDLNLKEKNNTANNDSKDLEKGNEIEKNNTPSINTKKSIQLKESKKEEDEE